LVSVVVAGVEAQHPAEEVETEAPVPAAEVPSVEAPTNYTLPAHVSVQVPVLVTAQEAPTNYTLPAHVSVQVPVLVTAQAPVLMPTQMPVQIPAVSAHTSAPDGSNPADFSQWLLQGVKDVQQQQHAPPTAGHGWGQPAASQWPQQSAQHGGAAYHPDQGVQEPAAIALPEVPICPFEVKKLRVPEIKAMLNARGVHQEYMQGVLKKDLLEMLMAKLEEEGNLKEDPPSKKPRVYVEDDVSSEGEEGAEEEEESEEYDPDSDESGAEQEDDDVIWDGKDNDSD